MKKGLSEAPRDGTPVLTFFEDFSGCEVIFFGESTEDGTPHWVNLDGEAVIKEGSGDDVYWHKLPRPTLPLIFERIYALSTKHGTDGIE